jgi:hypothetical protein
VKGKEAIEKEKKRDREEEKGMHKAGKRDRKM